MAQAPTYTRTTSFAQDEANNAGGRATVRTDRVDAELDNVGASINALRSNAALIQRDDGALRDLVVTPESLSAKTAAMFGGSDFEPRGTWAAGAFYAAKDLIENAGVIYVCLVSHTAAALFATDRSAGKWQLVPGGQTADAIVFTPTATVAGPTVQDAVEQIDSSLRSLSLSDYAFNYGGF
jgi:hypothetical protein